MFRVNNMLVSIVIPVYNCENYLEKCIDSVLGQTYENIEIVLVDDGSTDHTGTICDKFAEKDKRVKVIHQYNQGLISAWNAGVRASTGGYVAFLDGDDWLEEHHVKMMFLAMREAEADLLVTGICREEGERIFIQKNNMETGLYDETIISKFWMKALYFDGFFNFGIQPYRVSKMFRRDLLIECMQMEDSTIREAEDAVLVFTYMFFCKKILVTDQCTYHYVIRKESMTQNRKFDYFENVCKVYLQLKKNFVSLQVYDIMKPQLEAYMRMLVWLENPSSFIESQKYVFPFKRVPVGARLIIYGAGYVGKIFVHQVRQSGYCDIVAWIDKSARVSNTGIVGIVSPDVIDDLEYDFIVIAIDNGKVAEEVSLSLRARGIGKEKIIIGVDKMTTPK